MCQGAVFRRAGGEEDSAAGHADKFLEENRGDERQDWDLVIQRDEKVKESEVAKKAPGPTIED